MRRVVGAMLLALALAGCSDASPPEPRPTATTSATPVPTTTLNVPGTIHVTGEVTLSNASGTAVYADTWGCFGQNDFADIAQAAQVEITDDVGRVIAVGSLGRGVPTFDVQGVPTQCVFDLHVDNVPDSGTKYLVSIGDRDDSAYTLAQLKAGLVITLG